MAKKTGTVKKKVVKVGAVGMAYVHSTFNNVIITITNEVGDVIRWVSAGRRKILPMQRRRLLPIVRRLLTTWVCVR